jgi:hypothetical protein
MKIIFLIHLHALPTARVHYLKGKVNAQVIEGLKVIYQKRVYLDWGFSSLFGFCVSELGYSEPAASRRCDAVYLSCEVPEVTKKFERGELSLNKAQKVARFHPR